MAQNRLDLTPWHTLKPDQQVFLRRRYQRELDKQPLTRDPKEKAARFMAWLKGEGVSFPQEVRRKTH